MNNLNLINGGLHRSGNTICITEWLAEDARPHGARVEPIHPVDRHIEHYRGCNACGRSGVLSSRTTKPRSCEQLDRTQEAIFCLPIFGGSQWREKHA